MRKFLFLTLLAYCTTTKVFGQHSKKEDVVYLNNHWVLRGKIIERNDSLVKIQTSDGNIFVYRTREVDSISRDAAWRNSAIAGKGLRSFTELGPLIAGRTTVNGVTTAAFSFQTFLGYAVTPHLIPGLGAGADLYATQTILPVFASIRGDVLSSGGILPFYFADLGYGINITQNSADDSNFKGGLLYAAGAGIKIPFNRTAGFLLSVGYRYQKTSYDATDGRQEVTYKRLALRAGFYF